MRAKFRDLPDRLRPFTVRNVADGFDVHPQTVRRWARAGVLACHKAGPRNHKLWFSEADIKAFLGTPKGIRTAWRTP